MFPRDSSALIHLITSCKAVSEKFEVVPCQAITNRQLRIPLWCGAVGVSEVEVERCGCFGGGDCSVDLVPLGLAGYAPPGRPGGT